VLHDPVSPLPSRHARSPNVRLVPGAEVRPHSSDVPLAPIPVVPGPNRLHQKRSSVQAPRPLCAIANSHEAVNASDQNRTIHAVRGRRVGTVITGLLLGPLTRRVVGATRAAPGGARRIPTCLRSAVENGAAAPQQSARRQRGRRQLRKLRQPASAMLPRRRPPEVSPSTSRLPFFGEKVASRLRARLRSALPRISKEQTLY